MRADLKKREAPIFSDIPTVCLAHTVQSSDGNSGAATDYLFGNDNMEHNEPDENFDSGDGNAVTLKDDPSVCYNVC